ncbi:LacI family DNA-binding transcriptional regulator [Mariluticola halotolerans]|uniref:LacI family DNA-binding transcriptional regulator n=1 Tax=Mariluticola halotolerans TaxID=2909283 RepID=UPI0026E3E02A|nr:LacI family DNA-binding transcriptional regulator [Mariluticola halotolerans]UJQ95124.1 LacI family transcriptional regulator [Mariluticola halotolerans]
MANIKDVAKEAGVSTATVSAVVNDTSFVSPALRARVQAAIDKLGYVPSQVARNLKRGSSKLIALVVADLSNPFYARIVCAAEAAAAAWGYCLVVFNSDEKPEVEKRILGRIRTLSCDGMIIAPVGGPAQYAPSEMKGLPPTVMFGRTTGHDAFDVVTLDNIEASRQVTSYLLDLGHRRIGTITGPLHLSTGRDRHAGMLAAMTERGLSPDPNHVRSGEFREDTAYSVARDMLSQPAPPSALYIANGVMALGVMRALADMGLKCPADISIASTDTIPGFGGLRPRLTRAEHPATEMTNEALRLLVDRITREPNAKQRNVVFQAALVLGESCAPLTLSVE